MGVQMRKYILFMVMATCSGTVWAADFVDTAKVVSSTPILERVSEPRQECWNETVSSTGAVTKSAPVEEHSVGGALLGGVIGGVVGSQIGQGHGNTVATGAGAIAGAIIGDRVASQNASQQAQATQDVPQVREEKHCRQIESFRDVIRGYNVTYQYNGKTATTRLASQPGDTVQVSVGVVGDTISSNSDVRDNRSSDVQDNRGNDAQDNRGGNKRGHRRRDNQNGGW